jgi:hypothetical protein
MYAVVLAEGVRVMTTKTSPTEAARAFLVVAGPLIGLAYILVLPCIGAAMLLYLGARRGILEAARIRDRLAPRTIR